MRRVGSVTVALGLAVAAALATLDLGTPASAATQFDIAAAGPRGPVTVIGDSVLVGAGAYAPTLPDRLVERGWGPIRFRAAGSATSGLFSVPTEFRSSFWISQWKQQGWDPQHVIVNLGTNDSGFCGTDSACAYATIMHLVSTIGPGHQIWWPTITKPATATRDTFNAALRRVEAERSDFHVWDWNAEFAAGGYRSGDQIHLDPASYVRRSARMAEVFTETFSGAVRVGDDAPLPAPLTAPGTLVPLAPRRILDTRLGDHARPGREDTVRVDFGDAIPDDATAVALYVAAVGADRRGYLSAGPCGLPPSGATVNFSATVAAGAPTVTALGSADDVCVYASESADVIVDLQAVVVDDARGDRLTPETTPIRLLDTRPTGRVTELRVNVAGAPSAVAVNLAAVNADGGGFLSAGPCGVEAEVANVNFTAGVATSAAAFVPLDHGSFCVTASRPVDVVVDLTGRLSRTGRLSYVPVAPTRTLDTRNGTGGWTPALGARQTIDVGVAPSSAEGVTGTLTVVRPPTNAFATAYGCVGDAPTASVNVGPATIAANTTTTGLFSGRLCLFSSAAMHAVFDTNGWWVPDG